MKRVRDRRYNDDIYMSVCMCVCIYYVYYMYICTYMNIYNKYIDIYVHYLYAERIFTN